MSSVHAYRVLGLLLGAVVAACSPQQNAAGESELQAITPATALPHSVLAEEDVQRVPGQPIEQLLSSRFSGVRVSRTSNGGPSLPIRGVRSFMARQQPPGGGGARAPPRPHPPRPRAPPTIQISRP